ncbi:ABC transporter permease [[Clostridium] polysaccharolyticum]|uniref:ABC-2 type transport system permease protein n=1 Tax=[Clostridium] polysaccharolyticum TaxID=29364 RepID=A0A1I0DYK5_9FIRM|nr:ABC transporter permease [[Clostridium] polysaccharolyticum]SET37124.1 hypothetical protein SAMN04487772_11729 [[Clostridium] polysaccharolyticum]
MLFLDRDLLRYRLKSLLADYTCCFWTFMFPFILAVVFCIMIPKTHYQNFQPIQVVIVKEGKRENIDMYRVLSLEKTSSGEALFHVSYCSQVMAKEKLDKHEIDAYIEKSKVVCAKNNSKGICVKVYVEWCKQTKQNADLDMQMRYISSDCVERTFDRNESYFLTLLALAAFTAIHWGIRTTYDLEGNLSSLAAHLLVMPVSKRRLGRYNFYAVMLIQFFQGIVLDAMLILGRGMKIIPVLPYFFLIQMVTSMTGFWGGRILCCILKGDLHDKQRIAEGISFLSGFLSGIMFYKMRYAIETAAPFFSWINPVSIASDALFYLYYVKDKRYYTEDLLVLFGIAVILNLIGLHLTRRDSYECL